MTQDNTVTMMTVRELAETGILTEHAIRLMLKQNKLPVLYTKALDIYMRYKNWCSDNGFGVENKGNFFDELRGKNLLSKSGTINGVTYQNVVKDYALIKDEVEETPTYYGYQSRKYDREYY